MGDRVRKILVADDGTALEVSLAADASVEELQKQLEARSGLPPAQQILINEQGVNLRANQRLGSPRVEAAIFFFNIRHVTAAELPPQPVVVPLLSEIPSEAAAMSEAFLRRADEICEVGRDTSREQQVMSRALGAACANLVGHTSYFTKKFQSVDDELKNTLQRYRTILATCEDYFAELQNVQIPPELQQHIPALANSTNFMDTEPLKQIRSHEHYAHAGLEQMEVRIAELRLSFGKFAQKVEEASAHGDKISPRGQHFAELAAKSAELSNMREKQYENRKALGECGGDEERAAMLLEKMGTEDGQMVATMHWVLAAKSTLRTEIHARMQVISDLQTNIRKMGKTTNGYYESLHGLDRYFVELGHVAHIKEAFAASLEEVQRRRLFKLQYEAELQEANRILKEMCDAEVAVRDVFWKAHGVHVPPALLPGLDLHPPQPVFEFSVFDEDLPDLGPLPVAQLRRASVSTDTPAPNPLQLSHIPRGRSGTDASSTSSDVAGESALQSPFAKQASSSIPSLGVASGVQSIGSIPSSAVQSDMSTQESTESSHGVISGADLGDSGRGQAALTSGDASGHTSGEASGDERQALQNSLSECRLNNAHLETQLDDTRAELEKAERDNEVRLETLQILRGIALPEHGPANSDSLDDTALVEAVQNSMGAAEDLRTTKLELEHANAQCQVWRQRSEARIAALEGFEVGDLALFLRSSERPDVYEAFNVGCPDHFLHTDGLGPDIGDKILGRITSKTKTTAAEGNPFGLDADRAYYLLAIQPIS